jgi:hypothetical protein
MDRHPWLHSAGGAIQALGEFPLILMQRETSVRAIVDAGFHSAGFIPGGVRGDLHDDGGRHGAGWTGADDPSRLAREVKAEPGLQSKPINDPAFTRPVSVIKRSGPTLPPLSDAFLEHLSIFLSAALA